jgi:hypothetical protein
VTSTVFQRRRRQHIQLALASLLLLAGLLLLYLSGDLIPESAASRAARLSAENGIRIASGDPRTFFVPPYAPRDARLVQVELTATDAESTSIALQGAETSLRQYPAGFVAKLIGAIFIAGEMHVGGAVAGGTVGPWWIILAAPAGLGREGIYATSLLGVHHELSSFVYRRRSETPARWAEFSPTGWLYKTDTKDIIGLADGPAPKPETGFLSLYGTSTEENDFNVYAEMMFTEPDTVARLARKHPLIRRKLDFVMAEYVAVDRRMKAVFRELRLQ